MGQTVTALAGDFPNNRFRDSRWPPSGCRRWPGTRSPPARARGDRRPVRWLERGLTARTLRRQATAQPSPRPRTAPRSPSRRRLTALRPRRPGPPADRRRTARALGVRGLHGSRKRPEHWVKRRPDAETFPSPMPCPHRHRDQVPAGAVRPRPDVPEGRVAVTSRGASWTGARAVGGFVPNRDGNRGTCRSAHPSAMMGGRSPTG